MSNPGDLSPRAPFRWPDFRRLFAAIACATLASRALAVVLGYEVYRLTGSKLALGVLGLVEAIPSLSLALYGGHIADRHDRRWILRMTLGASVLCAIGLAILTAANLGHAQLIVLYMVVFIAGIARGFADPAANALEAQVVPFDMLVYSSTVMATCWMSSAVVGPLIGGYLFYLVGSSWTYLWIASLFAASWIAVTRMAPRPMPAASNESIWESVLTGVRYVMGNQVLMGSMALDLFAVLFGGAIAILPVFAKDILHVGPVGLGTLNAAPPAGALIAVLVSSWIPPVKHAGRNLFMAVTGFGVAMIVFALSESFTLSLVVLFMSGVFDGISVVIRRSILRLLSPDHLRGRIAAVSMIFIGSSNEIGAFESGVAASVFGTTRSVWLGAIVTLLVVAMAAVLAPKLRRLSLDRQGSHAKDSEVDYELDALEAGPQTARGDDAATG